MDYINASSDAVAEKADSDKIKRIHERVRTVRTSEKTGVKFMQWWEEKAYAREEGWAEGLEEGLAAGREEGQSEGRLSLLVQQVCQKLKKGLSPETISEHLEIDIEQISLICDIAKDYAPEYDINIIISKLLSK